MVAKKGKKKAKKKVAKRKPAKKKAKKRSKKKVRKKPAHRPAKYDKEFADRAERYIARNKEDYAGLAEIFGVSVRTIYSWMKEKPKFAAAVQRGKQLTCNEIEHTVRQLATPHDEETATYVNVHGKKGQKDEEVLFDKKVKKGVVNMNAARIILNADDPERFGRRVNVAPAESLTDIIAIVLANK